MLRRQIKRQTFNIKRRTYMKINLEIGRLVLRQSGKKKTYQLDIHFVNKLGRFRQSTDTSIKEVAIERAKKLCDKEYNRRLLGYGSVRITPATYLKENHIPQLKDEIGIPLENKPSVIRSDEKTTSDINILRRYFLPFIYKKQWLYLETSKAGYDLTAYLRKKGIKDQTVSNYLGVYNRFLRYALLDGYITNLPRYPALSKGKRIRGQYVQGYAIATTEMIAGVEQTLLKAIEETSHLGRRRAKLLSYCWFLILSDTGIRPYSRPSLTWNDLRYGKDEIVYIWRNEKNIEYQAQGGDRTLRALKLLKKQYLSEGVNVEANKGLPLFHHKETKEQILTLTNSLNTSLKEAGWYDMTDNLNRKYRAYSIRKWSLNESYRNGEQGELVSDRVGHSYDTFKKCYMDLEYDAPKKADIFKTRIEDAITGEI